MNYIYCQNCFKKTQQTTDLVKFCAHCGKPFIETNANVSTNANTQTRISSKTKLSKEDEQTLLRLKRLAAFKKMELEATIDDDDDDDNDGTEIDDDNLDDDSLINLPTIEELKMEIDIEQDKGVPIRAVARNNQRKPPKKDKIIKRTEAEKQRFLQQFQKKASAIKSRRQNGKH